MTRWRTATPLPDVSHCNTASTVMEVVRTTRDPRMLALRALPETYKRNADMITLGYRIAAETGNPSPHAEGISVPEMDHNPNPPDRAGEP